MAKEVQTTIKLTLVGGQANPGPPLGPTLAQHGVNLMEFVNSYNEATKESRGEVVPAVVTIYTDRSFTFELKKAPASAMLLKALQKQKGSGEPHSNKIGELSKAQLEIIANEKFEDLNAKDINAAVNVIAGTARSMGIDIMG